jgi:MFS family permease
MRFPGRAGELARKQSSTPHYQTFPTPPPKTKGRPPSSSPPPPGSNHHRHASGVTNSSGQSATPLPKRQLAVLAVVALAEQTAFNSIGPYLPQMTAGFPEVHPNDVGLYVGLIATAFALAQLLTNFFWGWLSDQIGRKPVILIGTLLTAANFLAFGFCRTLWQAILVQALLGVVNGNQGIVSSCLGEITDRSNQSQAFTYLPVIYGLGAITGPALGGLLGGKGSATYPFLPANVVASLLLVVDLIICMIWLEESLEEARTLPPLGKRVGELFSWVWQFTAHAKRPSYLRALHARYQHLTSGDSVDDLSDTDSDDSLGSVPHLFPDHVQKFSARQVLTRDTLLLLSTYTVFQLSNVAYNSLYLIFAEGQPPTGRALSAADVGLSLSAAGVVTIMFQVGVFNQLRAKMGNNATYRSCLGAFVIVFLLMPFVGYQDERGGLVGGKAWLWAEMGGILLIKTTATVGGLTSALLLVSRDSTRHCPFSLTPYFYFMPLHS